MDTEPTQQSDLIGVEKTKNQEFLSVAVDASKFVFDKCVELACAVIDNLDRLAWMAIAVGASVGVFLGAYEVIGNVMNDPAAMTIFGDAQQYVRVLSSFGMFATSSFLLKYSQNGMQRKENLFDLNS